MTSKWVVCSHPRSNAELRLLCFPHAGGSSRVFHKWHEQLPETVEVCAIELPGRGRRLFETPFTNVDSLLPVLGAELLPFLDIPFVCFGHSLGAWIAFEFCRWLRETPQQTLQQTPQHLFVGASRAPHLPPDSPPIRDLPDLEFIAKLRRYSGTPEAIFNNPELMTLMIPALKGDFSLLETYQYRSGPPLDCPITCFWGKEDAIANQIDVAAWQQHTHTFRLEAVPGHHFFTHDPLFPQKLFSRNDVKLTPR
ncbi:MAG: thioesterase [Cyanothece sp. SIO2G6]|nr:thioesterase [Cyanothece sp. SIO2G6]